MAEGDCNFDPSLTLFDRLFRLSPCDICLSDAYNVITQPPEQRSFAHKEKNQRNENFALL